MALARGSQRLALAVRALCKIIGNNPDVVNPDANPLRRAVYDSVTLACDLFDEFIPPRTPTGALTYTATAETYTDGVSVPTNFDRSAGKYIIQVVLAGGMTIRYAVRLVKGSTGLDSDISEADFIGELEDAWGNCGQAFANMHVFGARATVIAAKRNVGGHLVDLDIGGASLATTTSAQPAVVEAPFVVTTITYKDAFAQQDRILIPATYLPLGKVSVAGDPASSVALTALIGKLVMTDSFLATRKGGGVTNNVMSISTVSNEKLYRRFFA